MNKSIVNFNIFVPYRYTLKQKDMLIISSREFRQNQKMYFERVDKGEQIIVQRGKDKAYALTPVNEDDMYFNAKMVERIKQSIKEVQEGKVTKVTNSEQVSDLLGL
jgi:PHD/YefM family antitoxin component YafN of YafNO toxin-antitoxin module